MVEGGLGGGPGSGGVFGWVPGVEVGVKVHDCEWGGVVDFVKGSEGGEHDTVVASQGEEFGVSEGGSGTGAARGFVVRSEEGGRTGSEFQVGGCHLFECEGIVKGRDWNVAAVDDRVGAGVRVQFSTRVEASERTLASGS